LFDRVCLALETVTGNNAAS